MNEMKQLVNWVRARRLDRDWSQAELAKRAGISRTAVSAIEGNRLVPSVAAALSLAEGLECSVEELVGAAAAGLRLKSGWAWPPLKLPCRYWHAEVAGRTLLYTVESVGLARGPHDGVVDATGPKENRMARPEETLVMACCDPAAG